VSGVTHKPPIRLYVVQMTTLTGTIFIQSHDDNQEGNKWSGVTSTLNITCYIHIYTGLKLSMALISICLTIIESTSLEVTKQAMCV
jgi:hypothetical protein